MRSAGVREAAYSMNARGSVGGVVLETLGLPLEAALLLLVDMVDEGGG